mmetsp:Transcript_21760/g.35025  ORF Transcript_21760/g.35025 Transcript_21760/m.35025 type:complete len:99 (-) Transcript_21760:1037-1333(-)|eukprot:CAMPEP_0178798166 /NCGR_PEP_ID=MMETSP0745-20121128/11605_1 /TAXON_ID=913974 /ORGANISM="Nitzschia punctata, Strain CCMP561" /LENGTH=98 /DNA_ID=CAMNT_0020456789 /DNA_START=32 /DNA_END=328 /DNA_ORIENTATION=-
MIPLSQLPTGMAAGGGVLIEYQPSSSSSSSSSGGEDSKPFSYSLVSVSYHRYADEQEGREFQPLFFRSNKLSGFHQLFAIPDGLLCCLPNLTRCERYS